MRIKVPATTANVGCGYDTFGMALGYYNYIEFCEAEEASVRIIGQGARHLPRDGRNLILRSAQAVYDHAGRGPARLAITAHNNIPLSRGMGSSSAAIVGGLLAANQALTQPLSTQDLLKLATEIEGHPDNVAPALLGGFTISVHTEAGGLRFKRIKIPAALKAVLAIPNFHVSTKKARAIMPRELPLGDAIFNIGHAAFLAASLAEGDLCGFGEMLQDRVHQPYRFTLIPGAEAVASAAQAAGARGCVISGSGPTMVAFHSGEKSKGREIGAAMKKAFAAHQAQAWIMQVNLDNRGAQIEK